MTRFDTTQWSVVLRSRGEQVEARAALESLCRSYRSPVLAYIRARGHAPDVAEDLTPSFFVHFVERALANYERAYGLRSVTLRYFNAAGADPDGVAAFGEFDVQSTHRACSSFSIVRTIAWGVPRPPSTTTSATSR